jgi:hypothetical protein
VAAAALILAQGAAILALLPRASGPGYQTASQGAVAAEGAEFLIAFAPDAKLAEIGAWLIAHHASIVDGPRGGGVYRVRVGDKSIAKDELSALAADLSKAPFVRMVLPEGGK